MENNEHLGVQQIFTIYPEMFQLNKGIQLHGNSPAGVVVKVKASELKGIIKEDLLLGITAEAIQFLLWFLQNDGKTVLEGLKNHTLDGYSYGYASEEGGSDGG